MRSASQEGNLNDNYFKVTIDARNSGIPRTA